MTAILVARRRHDQRPRPRVVDGDLRDRRASTARPFPPATPFPGLVEFDAAELVAPRARRRRRGRSPRPASRSRPSASPTSGRARSCGTAPPASRSGPALGWQDLRTVGECIAAKAEHDLALAPNQSATKLAWLLANIAGRRATATSASARSTRGWRGRCPAAPSTSPTTPTPPSPACWPSTGRRGTTRARRRSASPRRCCRRSSTRPASSATATALPGAPPIAALVGDQQASLVGQGCVDAGPGQDHVRHRRHARRVPGHRRARPSARRGEHGTYPIVAWSRRRRAHVGRRGDHAGGRHATSSGCATTSASSPPAPRATTSPRRVRRRRRRRVRAGAARPRHAARGTTARGARCSASPGARRGPTSCAPCWRASPTAAPTSSRRPRPTPGWRSSALRVDGGMSANPTFAQALADATGRPVEVSPVVEATTLGAGVPRRPRDRACGATSPTPTGPGHRRASSSPAAPLDRAGVGAGRRAGRRLDPRAVGARLRDGAS